MEIALVVLIVIVITIWQGRRMQRRRLAKRKRLFKRPIWNILNRQPRPLMCLQINRELEKITSLPQIPDVELFIILKEMVREGTLTASVHVQEIGDPPIEAKIMKFEITRGSEPPLPPREGPEDSEQDSPRPVHA